MPSAELERPKPIRAREVLENREFRGFLAANWLFHLCASSMTVMLAFHIYSLRNSPLDIAALGFVQVIPAVSFSIYAGDLADRRPRRGIVLICFVGLALLAGLLALASYFDLVEVWLILGIGFLAAVFRAFENPANIGLEAQVVPRQHILKALPILSTSARIADMVGPVLMGGIWAIGGAVATYGSMAAILVLSGVSMALWVAAKPAPVVAATETVMTRIKEGWRFVWGNQVLWGSMVLDLCAVFFGGAAALLPIFATDILDVGPEGFGLLRSAIAAGTLIAAFATIYAMPTVNAGRALHFIVAGFGLSMIVFALSTHFWLSMFVLFLAGICDGYSMVIRHAILRVASPEAMRGRIAAVRMIFVASSNELGGVQSGTMTNFLGPVRAVVIGGTLTVAATVIIARSLPALRNLNFVTYQLPPDRPERPTDGSTKG